MMALIDLQGVSKAFGFVPALRSVDLAIERGESVAVLGPNGGGKSTLLRLLAGLSKPTVGTLMIGGWQMPREAAAVRAQIGMVAHRPLLYENLSAAENLQFFGRLYGLDRAQQKARADALLAQVGLARRAADPVRTFSRGMQQRLSIARALLHEPDVLLFDEPHTGLDPSAAALLDDIILQQRAQGRTIVLATHELERASALVSRVLILARGKVVHDAPWTGDGLSLPMLYAEKTL